MSSAYDTQMRVWRKKIEPLVEDKQLTWLFEELMNDMHDANHKCTHQDSNTNGDGVNKDKNVARSARRLAEHVEDTDGETGTTS